MQPRNAIYSGAVAVSGVVGVAAASFVGIGTATAATNPATLTAGATGTTINISVTNPNPVPPDEQDGKLGAVCMPLVFEYDLENDDPFRWRPDLEFDETPMSEAEAVALLISRGVAPAGRTASSAVQVPGPGVYVVGAVCQSDLEPGETFSRIRPVTVGSANSGPPTATSVQGRTIRASVTNNTGVAGSQCSAVVAELGYPGDLFRYEPPEIENPIAVTVPRDGYYAVTGVCGTPDGELISYSKPADVVTVPGGGAPPAQNCLGSVCLPARQP